VASSTLKCDSFNGQKFPIALPRYVAISGDEKPPLEGYDPSGDLPHLVTHSDAAEPLTQTGETDERHPQ
jgi:hypothetical protein